MIERRRSYIKQEPSKDAHKIYIICEGTLTEPKYFEFFRNLSSNLEIITLPPTKGYGNDPLKLMTYAKNVFVGDAGKYTLDFNLHDTIWFVVDTDRWEMEGKIAQLRRFCDTENKDTSKNKQSEYKAWNVAQSNPCFEIWLYYHLYEVQPTREAVERYASFKEFVHNSISGGFNMDIHPIEIETAIQNAHRNYSTNAENNPDVYSTEMHILGSEILKFVEPELKRLKAHK